MILHVFSVACDFLKNARAAKSDRKFEQDFSYVYVFE